MGYPVDTGFTSGYSIGLAQALNPSNPAKPMRAAAELWHYLCYKHNDALGTQKMESRDGYFYVKFEWWERITGYSDRTFTEACSLLKRAGLIDYKKMYILGTHTSCNHFKLLYPTWELAPNNAHFAKPDSNPLRVSGTEPTSGPYNNEDNIEEKEQGFEPNGSKTLTPPAFPLGAERNGKVSVRPNKKEADPARRPFAVGKTVLKAWGFKAAKIGVPMAKLIKGWLDAGFDDKDIIEAGEMMKKSGDSYWAQATPIQMLTQNAMLWYQQHKQKQTLDDIPHIEIGGRYYEIEPQTGKPIREIKL